jgi:FtsP/CotA-like multicopper oxidase with cupredoxin domain
MTRRKLWLSTRLTRTAVIVVALATSAGMLAQNNSAKNKVTIDQVYVEKFKKIAPSVQKKAAKDARLKGFKPGIAGLATASGGISAMAATESGRISTMAVQAPAPGGVPHYFGPYGNWAFSPLPAGPIATVSVVDGGSGYTTPIVTIDDAYLPAASFTPANVTATVGAGGIITGFTIVDGGAGYMAPVVTITDSAGTGALADAIIGGTLTGGIRKFVDGLPGLTAAGANNLGQYIAVGVPEACTYSGQAADCYSIALVEYEEKMHSDLPATKLRGYVQLETPALLAIVTASRSDADLTNDLPLSKHLAVPGGKFAYDNPHYLGPVIVAKGKVAGLAATNTAAVPRPVRITFYNLLPNSASGGNLLLPVDETVPGAGVGPALPGSAGDKYTQNRATIHLHGNNTVWISDGNTHQWITPASEDTPYPAGVSARNVPDMGTGCDAVAGTGLPGDPASKKSSGCMTFFYTNAQSARLQFYHDHAHGITRLNVYAGEAAGYVVTDAVEHDMIAGTNVTGVNIPSVAGSPTPFKQVLPDIGIPLVIQDKTFVDAATIYAQDPTWAWGSGAPGTAVTGDFWYPHVYMTVTNPWDPTGTNPFGRWFYGPWFNPPTPTCVNGGPAGCIDVGPVPNPYHQAACDLVPPGPGCTAPWEPPFNPGVPNPSIPGESFLDTMIVNGTAYPSLTVEPTAYRFRILNASNDRALNLQLYLAADKTADTTATALAPAPLCNGAVPVANCTEVRMVPVSVAPKNQYADTPSGIPDPTTAGPSWIQIGTEGGFTPAPVVIPPKPIGYNLDPAYFNFGIVNQHSLFLMAAERSDVIVDFSQFAGKTLILYNDSPAPVPAGAAPYDNYTGDGNLMDSGGAPNTQPGYGPNTRTIMQIQVAAATTTPVAYDLASLNAVFAKTPTKRGVFEVSQDPTIVPQAAYNSAYNQTFPTGASQYVLGIGDTQKNFQPLGYDSVANAWNLQPAVTIPFEMKAMHDEMGGVYDTGFGRMSGMLGLTNPSSALGFILPFPFSSPPTDVVQGSLESTKIGQLADGTQIWRIFHNGVDTHPIHTHLFTTQVLSRVGQDGQVAPGAFPAGSAVDAQDVGWKDTVKVNPLEVTFLALRPTVPAPTEIPFELPNSVRLIDPTLPDGATLPPPGPAGWFDPNGNPIAEILNHTVNFGWEYVWHCHILSHEEMDFMHSLVFAVPPKAPALSTAFTITGNGGNKTVNLSWTSSSQTVSQFAVERASDANFTTGLRTANVAANIRTYSDRIGNVNNVAYFYRVKAIGQTVGDTTTAGFPTMAADSVSGVITVPVGTPSSVVPAAPTLPRATVQSGPQVSFTWRDNATNETGFVLERCTVVSPATTCINFAQIAAPGPRSSTGDVTYVDTNVLAGSSYLYRVMAINAAGASLYATLATPVAIPAPPVAPTSFRVAVVRGNGNNDTASLTWTMVPNVNPTNFTIQRANNLDFTRGLNSFTPAGTARSLTQTVNRNTVYYYRIRANNNVGASSAWTNALPFPIRTP